MINKIGYNVFTQKYNAHSNAKDKKNQPQLNNSYTSNTISNIYPKSYVNFTGQEKKEVAQQKISSEKIGNLPDTKETPTDKINEIKANSSDEGLELFLASENIAKEYGYNEINEKHLFFAHILGNLDLIDDIENGKISENTPLPEDTMIYTQLLGDDVFDDDDKRDSLKDFMEAKIDELEADLKKNSPNIKNVKDITYNKEVADTLYGVFQAVKEQCKGQQISIQPSFMINALTPMKRENGSNIIIDTFKELSESLLMGPSDEPMEEFHLSAYDDKAKKVLKNLSLGVNMFVLGDEGTKPDYLINSISYILETSENSHGKLNKNNAEFTMIENATNKKLLSAIKELSKDESKTHIIAFNMDTWWRNDSKSDNEGRSLWSPGEKLYDLITNPPKNIKFIAIQNKSGYYEFMKQPFLATLFKNFGDTSIPMMSPNQAKEAFKEEPLLMKDIDKTFTPEALDKTIEAAALLEGSYPEKAQNLMKRLSIYHVEKDKIDVADVNSYMEEAKNLFKASSEDGKVQIIFDTNKNLSQFLGKESTKHEAELIVKEIKNGTLGSKPMLIYSADDTIGSGRRFTAQAIAGEAKVPYAEINAMDFAIKGDMDTGMVVYPDDNIKQIFSMLRAQAEANPDKAAVLYIDNTEYFMAGQEISPRYTNLMPVIQREMKTANDKGLNILVLGAIQDSKIAGSVLAQSCGFTDSICVDTPMNDFAGREKIIEDAMNKLNLNVIGDENAKKEFLTFASQLTEYFSFADLSSLIKKTRSVAVEREHNAISKEDLVEGYMRLTTGRPAPTKMPDYEKRLVTSHECGHATNLEVMRNLAIDEQIPWRSPEKVNFITLDPRGFYGGAVYHSSSVENPETSFEKIFSNIVCSYGGHSAEKKFFDMDGSWGITSDLEHATSTAQKMALIMGLGSVKQSVNGMNVLSHDKQTKMENDSDVFASNALIASDLITDAYEEFNKDFTEKYSSLVGTGACMILGSTFREELQNWIKNQPTAKRAELQKLNKTLKEIIDSAKRGIKYTVENSYSTNSWYKSLSM